ncbi:MAG: polysaccharide biosynthesis C-terminal domain-containing protein [Deltaproteobacteria bacterium]|nr:polysaccharide biosynthesis C-terminal domain-containing protein [Deltaproteobacteria bacterium]
MQEFPCLSVGGALAGAADYTLLKRGAFVNLLGTLGRLSLGLLPLVASRLYGPGFSGVALVMASVGICSFLCSAGFSDAAQFLCAHPFDTELKRKDIERIHGVVLAAAAYAIGVSTLCAIVLGATGETLGSLLFSRPGLGPAFLVVAASLPFMSLASITTAVMRSSMRMGSDVIVKSLVLPLVLFASLALLRQATPTSIAICWAFTISQVTAAAVALFLYCRRFKPHGLRSAWGAAPHRAVLRFALPQSLNMAFYQATFDVDLLLLGMASLPDRLITAYRVGSEIARQIFTIRVAFAGVYASLVARLAREGRTSLLSQSIGKVSGWCLWLAAPVAGLCILLRHGILEVAKAPTGQTSFFVVLLLSAVVSCTFGLSGNVLGMSGRPALNLVNAVIATAVNVSLNLLLVPRLQLLGAAIAVATGTCVQQILQLAQVRVLLNVRFSARPLLAATIPVSIAAMSAFVSASLSHSVWLPVAVFIVGYLLVLWPFLGVGRRVHVAV